jgi:hypothetical protein
MNPTTKPKSLPAVVQSLPLNSVYDVLHLGEVLAKSGYFESARTGAQAVVKILAGRELGFGPIAAMTGVHVIDGRPSIGSHLMAAAIRQSGRYDYEILEHTDQVCAVRFKRLTGNTWKELEPVERLTLDEAVQKGWTVTQNGKPKGPWLKTPKNMLFARVISNGYRFHCPDLIGGVCVYDPDELEGAAIEVPAQVTPAIAGSLPEPPPPVQSSEQPNGRLEPSDPTQRISEEQLTELSSLIRETQTDVGKLLKYYRAPVLARLTTEQAQDALGRLRAKLQPAS